MPSHPGGVFRKTGPPDDLDMFEAEADGLKELAAANVVRVPEVYDVGTNKHGAYIEIERLSLRTPNAGCAATFGKQLAELHKKRDREFGWHRDNTIGATPQLNTQDDNWLAFFAEQRIAYQLNLAERNGFNGQLLDSGDALLEGLPALFVDYEPVPSLLHGDLWSGNWGMVDGEPVIFDPAVYYGDRETDIAMTRLFGGFVREFYEAYESAWPLAPGFERRASLYQLYHLLNHLNLFGSGYYDKSLRLIKALVQA